MKTLDNDTITSEIEQLALRLLAPPRWRFWRRRERVTILERMKRKSLAKDVVRDTLRMLLTELQSDEQWSADKIMSAKEAVRK
jgi:hypothetical protein